MGLIKDLIIGRTDQVLATLISEAQDVTLFNLSETGAENVSTIYSCAKILSDTISTIPIFIYKGDTEDGKIKLKDDYRYKLLHYNPTPYQSAQTFFSTLEYHRTLKGNAFAKIHRNLINGKVTMLEIIHPGLVSTKYSMTDDQLYYHVFNQKDPKKYEKVNSNEMLHFKSISQDGVFGVSPIKALIQQLTTTYSGYETLKKYYGSGLKPGMLLKSTITSGSAGKNIDKSIEEFESKIKGFTNQNKVVKLPMFTEPIIHDFSIEDSKILDTIKFNKSDIGAVFGIPPFMLGDYTQSKYSNIEQVTLAFRSQTIRPLATIYRRELEFKLLTNTEIVNDYSIEFNTNAIIELDYATKMDNYIKLVQNGVITPNKVAKLEGFETSDSGDVYYVSNNHQIANKMLERKELELEKLKIEIENSKKMNNKF